MDRLICVHTVVPLVADFFKPRHPVGWVHYQFQPSLLFFLFSSSCQQSWGQLCNPWFETDQASLAHAQCKKQCLARLLLVMHAWSWSLRNDPQKPLRTPNPCAIEDAQWQIIPTMEGLHSRAQCTISKIKKRKGHTSVRYSLNGAVTQRTTEYMW